MEEEIPDWFWQLIESSEHKLQCLAEKLELLTKEQLIAFQFQYEDAKELVSPMWANEPGEIGSYIEECSEDNADDFADWVVSQGRNFFDDVKSNPASGPEYLTMYEQHDRDEMFLHLCWNDDVEREEYRGLQSPGFIARGVYECRFGESLYDLIANRA